MANPYFQFKQFTIYHDRCAMKVTTDACLFGGWATEKVRSRETRAGRTGVQARRVLDLGAGTGLLALMLAQKNPGIVIEAIEIDEDAAQQAGENVNASPWKDRINVISGDARTFRFGKKYDYIISNPPFYEDELSSPDQRRNTAHHAGGLALQDVATIIKENIAPGGWFLLLLPYKRNAAISDLLARNEMLVSKMVFVRQSVGHDYFRVMLMGQVKDRLGDAKSQEEDHTSATETAIDDLAINDEKGQYTRDFVALLQSFYLYL